VPYDGEQKAREDVRTGKLDDAVLSPGSIRAACSRRTLGIGLVVDNTDEAISNSVGAKMQSLVDR
jgi:ABC-2 type transport system permease protein